ncbi:hypothetical protein C7212DRAFT_341965 [Tuber magnatum]|uniref:Uncharacterized protein n=1 Tax=Tuber magnatum TaxID=42249 RepID=A0A317SZ70_9PEZI|nr:hypothetical protein C7212DRAFT_341965 [Tuber magnatum]
MDLNHTSDENYMPPQTKDIAIVLGGGKNTKKRELEDSKRVTEMQEEIASTKEETIACTAGGSTLDSIEECSQTVLKIVASKNLQELVDDLEEDYSELKERVRRLGEKINKQGEKISSLGDQDSSPWAEEDGQREPDSGEWEPEEGLDNFEENTMEKAAPVPTYAKTAKKGNAKALGDITVMQSKKAARKTTSDFLAEWERCFTIRCTKRVYDRLLRKKGLSSKCQDLSQ